jgi:hypothetical protein
MIINAQSIILTLVVLVLACYGGLKFIRAFALQIAQENHDAIAAMEVADEDKRRKREQAADQAAESAFAKVQPILIQPVTKVPPAPKSTDGSLVVSTV